LRPENAERRGNGAGIVKKGLEPGLLRETSGAERLRKRQAWRVGGVGAEFFNGLLDVLADPDKTFEDAVRAVQADVVDDEEGLVERSIATAISALKKPGLAYMGANERAKELWKELIENVNKINKIIQS